MLKSSFLKYKEKYNLMFSIFGKNKVKFPTNLSCRVHVVSNTKYFKRFFE